MAEFAVDAIVSTSTATAIEVKIDLVIRELRNLRWQTFMEDSFFRSVLKKAPFHADFQIRHPFDG